MRVGDDPSVLPWHNMAAKDTIYRGTNINPQHLEAWDRLAGHAMMKRNAFLRFLLDTLTEDDVDMLINRL
jgi:hypothetical protein